jgi:transglutaminase-like putative cysteine protease
MIDITQGLIMDSAPSTTYNKRWWDLPAAFLLFIIMSTAVYRISATEWTDGLHVTRTITYLGLIAGLALGQSRFSPRIAFLFAFFFGAFVVSWRLGMLMGTGVLWNERLLSMSGRLGTILTQLYTRQVVTDSFLFLVLMGLLFWALSSYAGYALTRYANPWRVILPTGLAMVLIHSYDSYEPSRIWYLIAYLFFSLILVARLVYLHNHNRWQSTNTYVPPYLGLDFVRIALAATVLLLLLTWTTPALADTLPAAQDVWQKIKQPWNDVRNTFDNAFASLRSTVGIVSDYYGPNLSLGRGNRLTDTEVFTVFVPVDKPQGIRYYWRARVYDEYDMGWRSTLLSTELVDPDTFRIRYSDMGENAPGEYSFAFRVATSLANLIFPSQVTWVSRPVKLELEYNFDGEADISSIRATPPVRAGETYNLRASFNQPTVLAMRRSGEVYPEWVTARYLQLPESITPRTIQLAEAIAGDAETPYDAVVAVTSYLRNNIEYSETVPALPPDQELVDWFLFDLKQGFCNYYATAEVVLLRALGIPARIAVGYAEGEPLDVTPAYTVRQRDSHAWPEVYFPGIGWVEFEPTVSQPEILRLSGAESESDSAVSTPNFPQPLDDQLLGSSRDPELRAQGTSPFSTPAAAVGISIALLVLVILLVFLLIPLARRKHWAERLPMLPVVLEKGFVRIGLQPPSFLKNLALRARLSPLARAYQEINAALARLGNQPSPTATPAERTQTLAQVLPPAGQPANRLLGEYQAAVYSRSYTPDLPSAQKDSGVIRSLSYRAWFQRLLSNPRSKR